MAKASGLGRTTVQQIWRAFGLQPHRRATFKLSTDPLLIEKVPDIVGLYMHPPTHAVVFCVDEKSQLQAWIARSRCCRCGPGRSNGARTTTVATDDHIVCRGQTARCCREIGETLSPDAVGQATANHGVQQVTEAFRVGHLARVESKRLFIQIPEQMKWLDRNIGVCQSALSSDQTFSGKPKQLIVAAVARELTGFLWAALTE